LPKPNTSNGRSIKILKEVLKKAHKNLEKADDTSGKEHIDALEQQISSL